MAADFIQAAQSLGDALQEFLRALRRWREDEAGLYKAIEQLRMAVVYTESLDDPSEEEWKKLSLEQQQAYLRLISHIDNAAYALQRLGCLEEPSIPIFDQGDRKGDGLVRNTSSWLGSWLGARKS